MKRDPGLDTLLGLHDVIIEQEHGYWVKIEAWSVPDSADLPHGICYALTLHEPYGKRIMGFDNAHFDNAHGVKPPRKYNSTLSDSCF